MPVFSLFVLEESQIATSDPNALDGVNQGDGSNLVGDTLTLLSNNFTEILIDDNDSTFGDNDGNQRLDAPATLTFVDQNGVTQTQTFAAGSRVEAEYRIFLTDGVNTYTAIGFNIRNSNPSFGTAEALAFVDEGLGFPPIGVELTVIGSSEGNAGGAVPFADFSAPPCIVDGAMILTEAGEKPVETIRIGDRLVTAYGDVQPVLWAGGRTIHPAEAERYEELRPIAVEPSPDFVAQKNARPVLLSRQHALLLSSHRTSLMFGCYEALASAGALVDCGAAELQRPTYGFRYNHILLASHDVIFANGMAVETLHPGERATLGLDRDAVASLERALAPLGVYGPQVRRRLRGAEVRAFLAARTQPGSRGESRSISRHLGGSEEFAQISNEALQSRTRYIG